MKSLSFVCLLAVASIVGASQIAVVPAFAGKKSCAEVGCIRPTSPRVIAEENGYKSPRPVDPSEEEGGSSMYTRSVASSESKGGGSGSGGGGSSGGDGE